MFSSPDNVHFTETILKSNLEFFILLILEMGERSGHQVMREIAKEFHYFLPQSTFYPLLGELEKGEKLNKRDGKGRERLLSLTPDAAEGLKTRKRDFLDAIGLFAAVIYASGCSGSEGEIQMGLAEFFGEKPE